MPKIPLDYVEGADETTVWMWPDSPKPVTVRFDRENWKRIQEAAGDENLEEFIGRKVTEDLEKSFPSEFDE